MKKKLFHVTLVADFVVEAVDSAQLRAKLIEIITQKSFSEKNFELTIQEITQDKSKELAANKKVLEEVNECETSKPLPHSPRKLQSRPTPRSGKTPSPKHRVKRT